MSHRLVTKGDILHVYNRGVDKRDIFLSDYDKLRFIEVLSFCRLYDYSFSDFKRILKSNTPSSFLNLLDEYYRYPKPLCKIFAYVLMPNHFHLMVAETIDGGISKFMQKVGVSYTKYFNNKNERSGHLFQGKYQHVFLDTEEQFIHLSKYIHRNPINAGISSSESLVDYQWSTYPEYVSDKQASLQDLFIDTQPILSYFKSPQSYAQFVEENTSQDGEFTLYKISIDNDSF